MAIFGLTDTGFNKKTLSDVLDTINEATVAAFGSPNVAPDSVFGQYNGIISEVASDIWDLADLIYASQYALSAIGLSLDAVAELNNLKRLGATASTATIVLEGTQGTVIPQDTQFKQNNTSELFKSTFVVTLDIANVLKVLLSINSVPGQPHIITIQKGGIPDVVVTSTITTSAAAIMVDLRDQINLDGTYLATLNPDDVEELFITNDSLSNITSFGILISASIDIEEQWTPASVQSLNTGEIPVPANSIQQIETTIAGLNFVDNLSAGTEGTETETDDEFRIRRKQSIKVVGAATVPAMEARLVQELLFVTAATVKDNRGDIDDDAGRPPHSMQAIITGGDDLTSDKQDILDKIWEIKPAGIETFGEVVGTIVDSTGEEQVLRYSRPIPKYIHFKILITLYDEEIFPTNGLASITEALVSFGETLQVGEDVIRQRFFTAIYSVSGVKNVTLFECATTENAVVSPPDPPIVTTETITSESPAGQYFISGATLQTDGVIAGMVVKDTGDPSIITTVIQVIDEENFIVETDVFNASDTIEFGDFGAVDIAINDNGISQFDINRIDVQIQP